MKLLKAGKICLTGSLIILSACAGFPNLHPHKIVLANGLCGEYEQVSQRPVQFKFKEWHPIKDCDGFYAFPPKDIADVRAWCDSHPQECPQ